MTVRSRSRRQTIALGGGLTLALAGFRPGAAWLNQTRDVQLAPAPVAGIIAVRDRYDRKATIAAGRVWQRLHLSATARGLAMQPLNQPIEMIDRERRAGQGDQWAKRIANLTRDDWEATFAFRTGYSSHAGRLSLGPRHDRRAGMG